MTEAALIRLAEFVARNPLTPDAATLSVLRDGVIDTLGCIHAGAGTEVATKARAAVRAMGALGAATVVGSDLRASRPQAAFLNAVAGHALDFDDWEIPGNTHPTVVLFPALLAVAGPGTSGDELAQAYLAGFEVIARLGEGLNFAHYDAGWHSTATLGAIGAAAGCARLLGLDQGQTLAALSFAISAASGYTCQFGSHAKPVQAGFAARAGVEAACLAQAGMGAQAHVLDHPRGMAALMGGFSPLRLQQALERLGRTYALADHGLVLKPWPSCGYTHRIMTCALDLRDRIAVHQIARIDLHLPDFHAAILPFGVPENRNEALFSLPFVAAMGLVDGGLTLDDLDGGRWADPKVRAVMDKITVHPFTPRRPDLNYAPEDPDRMEVTLLDGSTWAEQCVYPWGAPQAPMAPEAVRAKFLSTTGTTDAGWVDRLWSWPEADAVVALFTEEGPRP